METERVQGLAFMCDSDGVPHQWMRDDFGLTRSGDRQRTFIGLLDNSSHTKGLRFLTQLHKGGPVIDWELCFSVAGRPHPLNVAGVETGSETMILAARSSTALRALCRDLAASQTDQSRVYLDVLGAWETSTAAIDDADVYDDFMRMYNDFARLQRESASQSAKLQRVNAEKDRILNMAAHDLRNPLNVISLLAAGLSQQAGPRLLPGELSSLNKIVETARDMGRLIHDVLDTSRATIGQPEVLLQKGCLKQLVSSRIELIQPLANAKRIAIVFECDEALPSVPFDSGRIQQVIDNLLGNAIKFSPRDTRVQVHLRCAAGGLLVEVYDEGPGIPEHEQNRIFEAFVKGSAHPTDGEASSGLGLAICRSILDAHGGRIWAENTPHHGAVIKVFLPENAPLRRALTGPRAT